MIIEHSGDQLCDQTRMRPRIMNLITVVCVVSALICTAWLIGSPKRAYAQRVSLKGTTELEAQFFRDLRDGKAQKWELSDAFFIASGIRKPRSIERARSWINQLTEEASKDLQGYRLSLIHI